MKKMKTNKTHKTKKVMLLFIMLIFVLTSGLASFVVSAGTSDEEVGQWVTKIDSNGKEVMIFEYNDAPLEITRDYTNESFCQLNNDSIIAAEEQLLPLNNSQEESPKGDFVLSLAKPDLENVPVAQVEPASESGNNTLIYLAAGTVLILVFFGYCMFKAI